MKFFLTIFAICASLALVAGDHYFFGRGHRYFGHNALDYGQTFAASSRDPRQNRGPVVFPPSPPDAIDESSGVIVGASGYGFVPPQQSHAYNPTALQTPSAPSYDDFNYYSDPYLHQFNFL